ncbi:MAG: MFS transporter [Symploca sp. SIO3C6]|uniref:MFS transporter n=1 Tax=Symploca sp. SIO1C4 TaxID=2607765 RepID=A0A6B3NNF4_9CYAN|nr:MFS transporter [Symploca sp. SIO3C6]NER31071.1 MFS transporter [Symploca sp. SIO1C4]NET06769.1 MFS transporter [Symploca sp. SIO2B6]
MYLKWQTIAVFVAPAIPISALGLPLLVYLPPFYAEEMGLGLSLVGTIFMITRFWDVFTDPVLGIISDKVKTRLGRRRHWIILSVPILMLSVYQVFMPHSPVSGTYLLWWMVVLYVGYTLLSISHMSWAAELSPHYDERSRVQGWREFALFFGMLTVLLLPALVEQIAKASDTLKVSAMGWFTIILLPITVAIAVRMVPEHPVPKQPKLGFGRAIRLLWHNQPLQRLLIADLLVGAAPGITGSLYLFFATHVLELAQWESLILLFYFIAGFISIPGWMRLSYRLEKHRTLAVAMIYASITLALMLLLKPGVLWLSVLSIMLNGFSSGAGAFLLRSMMADVTDHDNLESGVQRTGLYYALLTMTNKISYALAVGFTYPMLDWIGFEPSGTNTAQTIEALKYMFIFMPMPLMLLAAIIMWNFPLDSKRQRELRRLIDERDSSS